MLDGSSEEDVSAQAYCVTGVSTTERFGPWLLSLPYSLYEPTYDWVDTDRAISGPSSANDHFCALNYVRGEFYNDADWVHVGWDDAYPWWYVEGSTSFLEKVAGTRCIDKSSL